MKDRIIKLDASKTDWLLLAQQKERLIEVRGELRQFREITRPRLNPRDLKAKKWIEAIEGLLNLLDYIQDQAASTLGEKEVFGNIIGQDEKGGLNEL